MIECDIAQMTSPTCVMWRGQLLHAQLHLRHDALRLLQFAHLVCDVGVLDDHDEQNGARLLRRHVPRLACSQRQDGTLTARVLVRANNCSQFTCYETSRVAIYVGLSLSYWQRSCGKLIRKCANDINVPRLGVITERQQGALACNRQRETSFCSIVYMLHCVSLTFYFFITSKRCRIWHATKASRFLSFCTENI